VGHKNNRTNIFIMKKCTFLYINRKIYMNIVFVGGRKRTRRRRRRGTRRTSCRPTWWARARRRPCSTDRDQW
jgi:hypothetical protein